MPSELANDPKRPHRDDDDANDESEDDEDAAPRERDEREFEDDLVEIADEFEPTLDVPLPVSDKPSRKRSRR